MAKRINVKLILELSAGGLTQNEIAVSRHFSKTSVSLVLKTAKELNVTVVDGKVNLPPPLIEKNCLPLSEKSAYRHRKKLLDFRMQETTLTRLPSRRRWNRLRCSTRTGVL